MPEDRTHDAQESGPDAALDRLRAADPAARLSPDPDALRAAVRARVAADDDLVVSGGPAQLAAARAARRGPHRWAAVAAVAAGALVVGSAGFALGERAGEDAPVAVGLPGPVGPLQDSVADGAGPATGDARPLSPEAADASILPWFSGRTVFRGEGLSTEADVAEAWAYDPAQVFGAETASLVASSLGLEDEPQLEGVTWTVGPLDGSGPQLQLQPDGVASVSYYDPTLDPFRCAAPVLEGAPDAGDGAASSGTAPAPEPADCDAVDGTAALEGDAAVAQAREVVAGAGADPDAFEYEVLDAGVPSATYVTAYATVGGQRTGNLWSMTLVGDAVQSLYGALAPLVPLGTYDVVSPADAVDRLTDPRFGVVAGGPAMASDAVAEPAPAPDDAVTAPAPVDGGSPPGTVEPGGIFAWPVTEVVLTGARLGLTQHTQPDGSTVLLPAYTLTGEDGATWTVVAVAASGLDFSPVP